MATILRCVTSVLILLPVVFCRTEPDKFLFISSPQLARVFYVRFQAKLPITGPGAPEHKAEALIDDGLQTPMGLATDQSRHRLLVADPGAKKILSYKILFLGDRAVAERPSVAMQNVDARWVSSDSRGTVFASDELRNTIWKVSSDAQLRNNLNPVELYSAATLSQVSAPAGLANDNFHIYWSNKVNTKVSGSVVKAFELPVSTDTSAAATVMTKNAEVVYGVCIAKDNLYYTASDTSLFGIKKNGGQPGLVNNKLKKPRGCAFDGDGTVFVADHAGGSGTGEVLAFAGNMPNIMQSKLSTVVKLEGAFGVAALNLMPSGAARMSAWLPMLAAWAVMMHWCS